MGTNDTTARLADISLPTDNGAIDQAFADLDARFSAWSSAVKEVHAALADGVVRRAAEDDTGTSRPAAREALRTVEPPPACDAGQIDEDRPADDDDAQAARPEPDTDRQPITAVEAVAEAPIAEGEPLTSHDDEPTRPLPGIRVEDAAVGRDDAPVEVERQPEQEDENAILASLDPETAAAVRVMRRLNPTGKSLRELIEEYRSSPPKSSGGGMSKGTKRSWWSRG